MTKVLGVSGSPRKGGNSDILVQHLLKGARSEGAATEMVRLRDYRFEPCIGCERCRKDGRCTGLQDGMQLIYPKINDAGGLVLVSPTHNYNVTAWMKAFIDRLYCYYVFTDDRPRGWCSQLAGQGRRAVIATVGEQPGLEEAVGLSMEAMRLPIEALGYEVTGELPVLGTFDKGLIRESPGVLANAEALGSRLAHELMGK